MERSISEKGKIVEEGQSYTSLLPVILYLTNHQIQYFPKDIQFDLCSNFIDVESFIHPDQSAIFFTCTLTHSKIKHR
ncbi:MAG: hypothetical protein ACI90Q_000485 [Nonlabens sp.]|jgi:hypothetical protein